MWSRLLQWVAPCLLHCGLGLERSFPAGLSIAPWIGPTSRLAKSKRHGKRASSSAGFRGAVRAVCAPQRGPASGLVFLPGACCVSFKDLRRIAAPENFLRVLTITEAGLHRKTWPAVRSTSTLNSPLFLCVVAFSAWSEKGWTHLVFARVPTGFLRLSI